MSIPVKMFTLSTCSHCKATKKFLSDAKVAFDFTDVDLLEGDEKQLVINEVIKYNPNRSFPTILIGDKVIYRLQRKSAAGGPGDKMTAEQLYEAMKKTQEPKGYFFNRDRDWTLSILSDLLVNKNRYGYMSCPCRLAAGDREKDRDIICPCAYREADVAEFGSCYCNLYVSRAWNEDLVEHVYVPERRPPEKMSL